VVAHRVFDRLQGQWQVNWAEGNLPAQAFWQRVIGEYTQSKDQGIEFCSVKIQSYSRSCAAKP
jgi:predicted acetyltransferase